MQRDILILSQRLPLVCTTYPLYTASDISSTLSLTAAQLFNVIQDKKDGKHRGAALKDEAIHYYCNLAPNASLLLASLLSTQQYEGGEFTTLDCPSNILFLNKKVEKFYNEGRVMFKDVNFVDLKFPSTTRPLCRMIQFWVIANLETAHYKLKILDLPQFQKLRLLIDNLMMTGLQECKQFQFLIGWVSCQNPQCCMNPLHRLLKKMSKE